MDRQPHIQTNGRTTKEYFNNFAHARSEIK